MEHQLATIIEENDQSVNYVDRIEISWRENLVREMFDWQREKG